MAGTFPKPIEYPYRENISKQILKLVIHYKEYHELQVSYHEIETTAVVDIEKG